ncbi:MAG: mannonate dehydratase [Methylacidiphilales bacterium]|nr:mannonate dehydratase [Candidatus Methylacidiphilales bacterium]
MAEHTPWLEQTWRWFGPSDPIPLQHIRQAGATGVVTALHHILNGAVWPVEEIRKRKAEIERAGLCWSVVESVPVHEDIKQSTGNAAGYLVNYGQSLRNLAMCGVRVVCYNFMPLLDWTRTQTAWLLPDGAEALRFDAVDAAIFDLHILQRQDAEKDHSPEIHRHAAKRFEQISAAQKEELMRTILLGLPGTVDNMTLDEFREKLRPYADIDSARLRENHAAFLRHVVPIAEDCGVALCIHPDDPPFPIFGLPRIVGTADDLASILAAIDSPANGITFCTGSLGAHPANDLPVMFRRFGSRVHFLHLRNVRREADGSFFEAGHLEGSTDMAAVMEAIIEELDARAARGDRKPLPMRPDHGHRMLGDLQHSFYAGYSAIGRLRGLAELRGLERGLRHNLGARP